MAPISTGRRMEPSPSVNLRARKCWSPGRNGNAKRLSTHFCARKCHGESCRTCRPAFSRATSAAIEVIQTLTPAISAILVQVLAASPTEIELELTDGRTVIWGGPDNSVRKSQILAGLVAGGVIGTVYDVSSPTSAVVR